MSGGERFATEGWVVHPEAGRVVVSLLIGAGRDLRREQNIQRAA
jgi:hypothetical protein